jgi:hypothetical protein
MATFQVFSTPQQAGSFRWGVDVSEEGLGFKRRVQDMSDEEYEQYANAYSKAINRQKRLNDSLYGTQSTTTGISTGTNANTKSNEYGGDWLNSNSNFSFDNMKTMAKDLAEQQLGIQDKLMGLSYGYRTKEKDLDSTIRQRENDQKFGFETTLQGLRDTQQLKVQENQFGQERTMFDKFTTAEMDRTESARRAANRLFYGRQR